MNLPEFVEAMNDAARQFSQDIDKAREVYAERLQHARNEFFEPDNVPVKAERRGRDD